MDADFARLEVRLNQFHEELRTLKADLEKLRATIAQVMAEAAEAQKAVTSASPQAKFAWMAPLIRRIENLEKRTGSAG